MLVDSTGDTNARDGVITLREGLLLAIGGLAVGDLDAGEADNVSGSPGAASADTISFSVSGTITLGSALPTLSSGNDALDGSAAGVVLDGVTRTFHCLEIASDSNTIRGLEIYNCRPGIRLHSGAQGNTIGGSTAGERNVISGNGDAGIIIEGSATTANVVKGNHIGVDAAGVAAFANYHGVVIQEGAQNNTIGGPGPGERNIISSNLQMGVRIAGSGTDGNTVSGNYIGTDVTGTTAIPNGGYGVGIELGARGNTIGGITAGERNIISGNSVDGIGIRNKGTWLNVVTGNYIGTDVAGVQALPNDLRGIVIYDGAQANRVGGSSSGERNVISGNTFSGLEIIGGMATYNVVSGNFIGTDAIGTAALPNGLYGLAITRGASDSVIGGSGSGEGNVISGHSYPGVYICGSETNVVLGNFIGTDASGGQPLGNSIGVLLNPCYWPSIVGGPHDTVIGGSGPGDGNVIAYNAGDGVQIDGIDATGNRVRGNSIFANGGKGIELINGGNTELVPPTITAAGSAAGTACASCAVDVYSDDEDEGRIYHGSATADISGIWSFPSAVVGPNVTAAATDASGNTSEFSVPFQVPSPIAVGGIVELRVPPGDPLQGQADGSGASTLPYAALAGAAAAAIALAAGGWYARRRSLR